MGTQHYGTSNITMRALLLLVAIIAASSAAPMSSGFARNDAVVPETRFVTTRSDYCHSGSVKDYECTGTLVDLGKFGSGSECREACETYAAEQSDSYYKKGKFCCTYKNGDSTGKCRISPGEESMESDDNWKSWQYNSKTC